MSVYAVSVKYITAVWQKKKKTLLWFHLFFSLSLQPLDFEKKPSYTVEIQVQNTHMDPRFMSAGSKDVATVRIAVEDMDEPPMFDKASYVMELKEDAEVGVAVGSISAVDPDAARSMVK